MYKVLANVNTSHTAYIFIRRNSLDVQLLPLNGQKNLDRTATGPLPVEMWYRELPYRYEGAGHYTRIPF